MKRILFIVIAYCVFLVSFQANAQYIIKQADKQFELYNYIKAIDLYEQAYKIKASLHASERLAESYKNINNYKQTESWYAIAVQMPGSKPENLLNYAKVLQNNSKYAEAKAQYLKYLGFDQNVHINQQNIWTASCDSATKWMENPKKVDIINQKMYNSPQADWGAVPYNGGVVFTSDRNSSITDVKKADKPFLRFDGTINTPDKKIYGWTGNGYLRLYNQVKATDTVSLFPLNTNTNYHVGAASFTADGNTMYFTLTRIPNKLEKPKGKPSTINVEIFSSVKENGAWSKPTAFNYNDVNNYSVGDPFISKDGTRLYFASNMPGGRGGTDLYVCMKTDAGEWSRPINLQDVNTQGNERSPVIAQNNKFYFASDGRIGMGGLDVFRAVMKDGQITEIENMGYPLNSPQDDFAFSLNEKGNIVYLSSNRTDGLGNDDIYSINEKDILNFKLIGIIFDKQTNKPLSNALITLKNDNNGNTLKVLTDDSGKFKFDLSKDATYILAGEKTAYQADKAMVTTKNLDISTVITKNLYLGAFELNKAIRIENIYYDFDKWNIRPDAAIELDKLVTILIDNPTIWIELGSHTDSRGNDRYNLDLSQKRAESAVQYIISRGIDKNRITAKGYGETQLINRCSNGVECSVEEHQLNRRTEIKILKY